MVNDDAIVKTASSDFIRLHQTTGAADFGAMLKWKCPKCAKVRMQKPKPN
jgi:hypothetical protein